MTPSAVMSLQSSPGTVRCPVTKHFLRVAGVHSQSTARGLDPRIGYFGDFRLTPGAIAASVLISPSCPLPLSIGNQGRFRRTSCGDHLPVPTGYRMNLIRPRQPTHIPLVE